MFFMVWRDDRSSVDLQDVRYVEDAIAPQGNFDENINTDRESRKEFGLWRSRQAFFNEYFVVAL